MNDKIKILQINCYKSQNTIEELNQIVHIYHFDLILVQEPPYDAINKRIRNLKIGKAIHSHGDTMIRAAIIVLNEDLQILQLKEPKPDMVEINISHNGTNIKIASYYIPPKQQGMRNDPIQIQDLKQFLRAYRNKLAIIGGDFNSQLYDWSPLSPYRNDYASSINQIITSVGAIIKNDNKIPTRIDPVTGKGTCIDLTITTKRASTRVEDWQVTNLINTSDHLAISFYVNIGNLPLPKPKERIDGTKIVNHLSTLNTNTMTPVEIVKNIHDTVRLATHKMPSKRRTYTKELRQKSRQYNFEFKQWKQILYKKKIGCFFV